MSCLLRYENVDISYGDSVVVRNINMQLNEGEILGIVGESGSGKTTVIKAAMGMLGMDGEVSRGSIFYNDTDLCTLSSGKLREINGCDISMVFQNSGASFCPIRTVGEQLYEIATAHNNISRKDHDAKVREILGNLGFEDVQRVLDSYPFELSGGMQQRVGIAAAMINRPRVILADEPTSALDVIVQKQVVEELINIHRKYNTAMIIVTHNIGVIEAMADRVIVMKDGNIVEEGTKEAIVSNPTHEYTKKLMAAVPRLKR